MSPNLLNTIIDDVLAMGRCWLDGDDPRQDSPLQLGKGPVFQLKINLSRTSLPTVDIFLSRDNERLELSELETVLPIQQFVTKNRHVFPFEPHFSSLALSSLQELSVADIPEDELDEFFCELKKSNWAEHVLPPEGWVTNDTPIEAIQPVLKLLSTTGQLLVGALHFSYAGGEALRFDDFSPIINKLDRKITPRNTDLEKACADQLASFGLVNVATGLDSIFVDARDLGSIVTQLNEAGWIVQADDVIRRSVTETQVRVSSGQDWFDLEGGLEFGDQFLTFPKLLEAVKKGAKTVQLDDGSEGIVPDEWLRRHGLLGMANAEDDVLRFGHNQGLLLDMLLQGIDQIDVDAQFDHWRREMRNFSGVKAPEEPENFCGDLRDYQKLGVGWIDFLRRFGFGGCLADDMGLGKTVQVLADVQARKNKAQNNGGSGPTLVVAPRSVAHNWISEAKKFTPDLQVVDYYGPDRNKHRQAVEKADITVTTYGILRRDISDLCGIPFRTVVLDEAQAIKNENSQTAKASRLLKSEERLALSGTPIENRLEELWSIFEFLNPGMLGTVKAFKQYSAEGPTARQELSSALAPFILRRKKEDVAKDLPARTEQILECELGSKQRQLYDELKEHYRASLMSRIENQGLNKSKIHVLEALLRLRQASCHPALIDESRHDEASAKLDLLLERLEEVVAEGHKVLVFSQFTKHLGLIKDRLKRMNLTFEYLDGRTRKRADKIQRFQTDPACPIFLISLKAGGTGLNLTAADYVFIMDPWWNPAVEAQAIDRSHRIGQTRQVFAYRLIARNTIEEKIVALQDDKRELARSILDGSSKSLRDLTADDLRFLLA